MPQEGEPGNEAVAVATYYDNTSLAE